MTDELRRYEEWLVERDKRILADNGGRSECIEQCRACGKTRMLWRKIEPEPDPKVIVQEMSVAECPRCQQVMARAPEVWDWVLGVTATQHVKLLNEIIELRKEIEDAATSLREEMTPCRPKSS